MNNYILKFGILITSISTVLMMFSFIVRLNSTPIDTDISSELSQNSFNNKIQVNVLNACGEPGLAAKVRNQLRELGFDVVEIGNNNTNLEESIVIDRLGDRLSSYKVSRALGINEKSITQNIDSTLYLRSTVVLGSDYKKLRLNL
ncbi:MAG: LytR C-terminal domain-containing protein [Chlorobiota bacterium]